PRAGGVVAVRRVAPRLREKGEPLHGGGGRHRGNGAPPARRGHPDEAGDRRRAGDEAAADGDGGIPRGGGARGRARAGVAVRVLRDCRAAGRVRRFPRAAGARVVRHDEPPVAIRKTRPRPRLRPRPRSGTWTWTSTWTW